MSQKANTYRTLQNKTKKLWMRVSNKTKKKNPKKKTKHNNTGDKGKDKLKGHTGYY